MHPGKANNKTIFYCFWQKVSIYSIFRIVFWHHTNALERCFSDVLLTRLLSCLKAVLFADMQLESSSLTLHLSSIISAQAAKQTNKQKKAGVQSVRGLACSPLGHIMAHVRNGRHAQYELDTWSRSTTITPIQVSLCFHALSYTSWRHSHNVHATVLKSQKVDRSRTATDICVHQWLATIFINQKVAQVSIRR